MKKVKNSIENKDLINTFKKLKYRNFLNKSNSKKIGFFLKKFYIEKIFLKRFSWKDFLEKIFLKRFSWKYTQKYSFLKKNTNKNNFLLITTMFIKLYFY
jgi:hypothetical protein